MSLHRFYLPPEKCRADMLRLDGREAHHALHVLRLQRGERVTVLDGAGREFLCDVESVSKNSLALAVKEKKSTPAPPCPLTLLVAVPKGRIIENIIQKAVELGAHRIVPLLTERVVTQLDDDGAEAKREKWQAVAIEAIKQCGAPWLPAVEAPLTLAGFLARGEKIELSLVGSLQTERRHPREWIQDFQKQHGRPPQSAAAWIGPEGDFTLAELQAIEAAGARPVTLGRLTLRVETAAIYCLSFLNYELDR
jgi:16S rRNA (uracil1498-N3)-methyltransferase